MQQHLVELEGSPFCAALSGFGKKSVRMGEAAVWVDETVALWRDGRHQLGDAGEVRFVDAISGLVSETEVQTVERVTGERDVQIDTGTTLHIDFMHAERWEQQAHFH